jgi:hypothetical protein
MTMLVWIASKLSLPLSEVVSATRLFCPLCAMIQRVYSLRTKGTQTFSCLSPSFKPSGKSG